MRNLALAVGEQSLWTNDEAFSVEFKSSQMPTYDVRNGRIVRHGRENYDGGSARIIAHHIECIGDFGGAFGEFPFASGCNRALRAFEIERLDNARDTMDEEIGGYSSRVIPIAPPV